MGLASLLQMTGSEMKDLGQFVRDQTLYVAVHPAWHSFFIGNDVHEDHASVIQTKVDTALRFMLYSARRLGTPAMEMFYPYVGDFQLPEDGEGLRKVSTTSSYMEALAKFFEAYQLLRETEFLSMLGKDNRLCLVVVPGMRPASSRTTSMATQKTNRFAKYLNGIANGTGSFVYVDSIHYNSGYMVDMLLSDGGAKIQQIRGLLDLLEVSSIRLFGEQLNVCVHHVGGELSGLGVGDVATMVDVSAHDPYYVSDILLSRVSNGAIIELMHANKTGYASISERINRLLEHPVDLSPLAIAVGKPPSEQLRAFERFGTVTEQLREIQAIMAYKHRTAPSGFNVAV